MPCQEIEIAWAPSRNDVLHVRSNPLTFGVRKEGNLMPLLVKIQEVTARNNDPIIIVVGTVEPKNDVTDGITIPPPPYSVIIFFDDRDGKGSLHRPH